MAIKTNMEKAKKKWEEERARAAAAARFGRPVTWWKPSVGTNKIRILPPYTEEGYNANQWWRELWVHYGVMAAENPDDQNQFTIACAAKTPDAASMLSMDPTKPISCKICAHMQELRSSGDPASVEMAKQSRAKMRIFANIIDLNDPVWTKKAIEEIKAKGCPEKSLPAEGKPKIQVFGFGTTIMKDLLDFYQDNVDLADIAEGHDITIEREGKDINTDYRTRPALKPSPAQYITEEDLSDMWNLDQLMPFMTDDQQELILAGGTREDVFALTSATAPEERQLESPKKKEEESSEETTETEESSEEAVEEEAVEEEATEEATEAAPEETAESSSMPLDKDGNIDYDKLKDEQIEDKGNANLVDKDGFKVYVECFGGARQRNPNDPDCAENCGLYERCGKRIETLDKEEAERKAAAAKKAAPGKKGPPGKATAPTPAAPAKKAPGKPTTAAPKTEGGSSALSLEEEMKRALNKK